ncbi:LOW QUALITY PROTEIN: proteolipid protein 2 [Eleutherodactylus coqui]|uniref:LOW QUALITY PROTEIN: proteolipid protein 2 n=1 Tax=Eleutherodactylus coqui TaxID=57060 RepID=UPI003462904B
MSDTEPERSASSKSLIIAYIRTRKGTIYIAEIVLCLIVLFCYAASYTVGYIGLPIAEIILAVIFFLVYALRYDQQFQVVHWPWSDFIRATVGGALFIIVCLVCLIRGGDGPGIAGSVFGVLTGILLLMMPIPYFHHEYQHTHKLQLSLLVTSNIHFVQAAGITSRWHAVHHPLQPSLVMKTPAA